MVTTSPRRTNGWYCVYRKIENGIKKTISKQKKIVKEFKENGETGTSYLEFTNKELSMFGLEKGDLVEWMQLEDREVWKKLVKKRWSI